MATANTPKGEGKRRSSTRTSHEANIISAAEEIFAKLGYNGASVDMIAERAGMSKQNMLYYFSSKEGLYRQVLENILNLWLEKMQLLEQAGEEPAEMLRNYILGKIHISQQHPNGSKVFAHEIISGAPYLADCLRENLIPQLEADLKLVRGWIDQGKMDPVDPLHLFFTIWAATQTYADFSRQIEIVLDKNELAEEDFSQAGEFLTHMVLKGLGISDAGAG